MLNCRKCKHDHNKVTCEKRRRETSHCFESKPETNFERIKAMSVEEMAEFLKRVCIGKEVEWTMGGILRYLESEVQEDE